MDSSVLTVSGHTAIEVARRTNASLPLSRDDVGLSATPAEPKHEVAATFVDAPHPHFTTRRATSTTTPSRYRSRTFPRRGEGYRASVPIMKRSVGAAVLALSACGYPLAQVVVRRWG